MKEHTACLQVRVCTWCQKDGEICAPAEGAAQLCHQDQKSAGINLVILAGVAYDPCKALEPPDEPPAFEQRFLYSRTSHWAIKWLWHAQQGRTS